MAILYNMNKFLFTRVILYLSLFLQACNFTYADVASNSIQWVDASHSELFLLNLEPAGIENGVHLLLCRGHQNNNYWIPGKIYTKDQFFSCIVSENGIGLEFSNFQVYLISCPYKLRRQKIADLCSYSGTMR